MSSKKQTKRLDWAKFTNFRSRNTTNDLARLCTSYSRIQLVEVFTTYDKTGLCPIHWAAINNRSDLIEFMLENGSPLRITCRNLLFANGSALHLAAMNGSMEAAGVLMRICEQQADVSQTKFKTLKLLKSATQTEQTPISSSVSPDEVRLGWLRERDSEGQTPLLRAAAPRSKRLDTVRDLLRKNLWSLSARPAEMALYLIHSGANWRETETTNNMNLLHLSIINDCDDIVAMLLVLDRDLLKARVLLKTSRSAMEQEKLQKVAKVEPKSASDMVTVDLGEQISSASSSGSESIGNSMKQPLIMREQVIKDRLMDDGILPLELAIVYCRVEAINLLWNANLIDQNDPLTGREQLAANRKELKRTLMRSCLYNRIELGRVFRVITLRTLLIADLIALMTIWIPIFLATGNEYGYEIQNGFFILFLSITLIFALRVMLRNPGYLRRNSVQYINELKRIVDERKKEKNNGELKEEEQNKNTNIRLPLVEQSIDPLEQVRLLCHKCQCVRRPRSRHCNFCNHCVQDFDHHCIYLSCCIGRRNRLDFLLMLIMVTLTAIYGTTLQATSMSRFFWDPFWRFVALFWIGKYILIGALPAFFLLKRACLGVTMYEEIRSTRIREIFGNLGPPEAIEKSHKVYATEKGTFWRYSPNRYLTGDLKASKLLYNFQEFCNFISIYEYLVSFACADTPAARSSISHFSYGIESRKTPFKPLV